MAHFVITTAQRPRKNGTSQIIVRYTFKGRHYPQKITNLYCKPDQLDNVSQNITKGYDREEMKRMNQKINYVKSIGNKILDEIDDPEPELFFKKLFEDPKEEKKKKSDNLVELYEEWLNTEVSSIVYTTTLPHLISFQDARGELQVQEYSKNLLKEFEKHMMTTGYIPYRKGMKKGKRNPTGTKIKKAERKMFSHTSMRKHLKHFKFFGRYLTEKELPINQNFRDFKFSIKSPEIPDTIALTKAEFDELFYFDLGDNFDLKLTKAAFIIGTASGGVRISDLLNWDDTSFDEVESTLTFTQLKTGGDVNNPLNSSYIKPFIKFYLANYTKLPSPQEFNRRLKEIAHLIGWERVEYVNDYRGDERKPQKIKVVIKDHISSKYMRKSFVSIMVELGYTKELIKSFTGHKDDKVIDHYIQIHKHTKIAVAEKFKPEPQLEKVQPTTKKIKKEDLQPNDQLSLF